MRTVTLSHPDLVAARGLAVDLPRASTLLLVWGRLTVEEASCHNQIFVDGSGAEIRESAALEVL